MTSSGLNRVPNKATDKLHFRAGNKFGALMLGLALSLPTMAALNARSGHDSRHREIRTGSDVLPGHSLNGGLACRRSAEPQAAPRAQSTPCTLRLVKRHQNKAMVWV